MPPLPAGFWLRLSSTTLRGRAGHRLVGGSPSRSVLLTQRGHLVLQQILTDGTTEAQPAARLARRLTDAGLADPRPVRQATDAEVAARVTVVIPARDRIDELEECLSALGTGPAVIVVDDGSIDSGAVAAVARRYGAHLVRSGGHGPSQARNRGRAAVTTDLIAFLDSDCVAPRHWLPELVPHFDDAALGAVAPRIRPAGGARRGRLAIAAGWSTYRQTRSPLDLGDRSGPVGPGRRVPYVPTAALVVRTSAVGSGFDESLRYGEDVDLLWRMVSDGWRIRYDSAVTVGHREPVGIRAELRRRFRYGTSAAALARRHPGRLAPLLVRPVVLTGIVAILSGHWPAALLGTLGFAVLAVRLARSWPQRPPDLRLAVRVVAMAARSTAVALSHVAGTILLPLTLIGLGQRRTRPLCLALLVGAPLGRWWTDRGGDPARWVSWEILLQGAYGAGVWWGCVRDRTWEPVVPRLAW